MKIYYELGDALRADRIAIEALDIDKVLIKEGSHRHRLQSTTLRRSAFCVIELPLRAVRGKTTNKLK